MYCLILKPIFVCIIDQIWVKLSSYNWQLPLKFNHLMHFIYAEYIFTDWLIDMFRIWGLILCWLVIQNSGLIHLLKSCKLQVCYLATVTPCPSRMMKRKRRVVTVIVADRKALILLLTFIATQNNIFNWYFSILSSQKLLKCHF